MNKEFNYRKGTRSDIKQFQELGVLAYGQFRDVLGEEGWEKMRSNCGDETTYLKLLEINESFVCEHEGKIIGMAFFIPGGNPFAFFEAEWCYIRLVGVNPAYEGKGIGRRLTRLCVDFAKQSGEKTLVLHTSEFQHAARHIYESMGFNKFRELAPVYGKQYWLYKLELQGPAEEISYLRAGMTDIELLVEMRMQFTTLLTGINEPVRVRELKNTLYRYFTGVLQTGSSIWIIARNGGRPIATGGVILRESPPNFKNPDGKIGYLVNMYTVPAFRRKGICSAILNRLVEEAKTLGVKAFELHATKEGEPVYVKEGFIMHDEPTYRMYIT